MYYPLNSGPGESDGGVDRSTARLANLPDGLTDRLVATVIATWTERIRDNDARMAAAIPKLQAALYGRVLATIQSVDIRPGVLDLDMIGADAPRSVAAQDGRVQCALPFSWLGDVWARGFATVLGHLCLSVETVEDASWQLRVVDPGLQGTRTMTVELA